MNIIPISRGIRKGGEPGGAEDGDADGDGDTDSGECVGRDLDEGACPGARLTEFEDGRLAIGQSCTHLLADQTCATMFFKAWAGTTFFGKTMHPIFSHPLPRGGRETEGRTKSPKLP
ncbi:hypothetical protein DVH24_012173 [Malus domestica]|uniref:Uncharacterized protein n=1 Tax=Malus domestica TaxID=3750 RepID=A0A498HNM9_MALDO|nr:hypothetical protein DVH24_012173 [Malus domestica]